MPIQLGRGQFFGRVVAAAQWESFRISETQYARGALLPWHQHEESYLTFVLAGGYRERTSRRVQSCGARAVVLHPAGESHEDDFAERPTRCLNVVPAASFTARLGGAGMPLERGDLAEGAHVASIGARLSAELRRADAASPLIVEGLLLELFGVLARESDSRSGPAWLAEVRSMLARRFAEKVTLAELGDAVGVHPVHLARAFRKHCGTSIGEHVRALRLEHARDEVLAGVPLAEVAVRSGFADQSHFTKAFSRAFGIGPAAYRRIQGRSSATRSSRAARRIVGA